MSAVVATGLFAGPAAAAGVAPPTDEVVIDSVTTNGSGCPGSATVTMLPGNADLAVAFSNYTALVGVGATTTDSRKNCQVNVVALVPDGYTYAVTSTEHVGFASLAAGASATQRANHYFSGQAQTAYLSHTFSGPLDDFWQTSDVVPAASLVWMPCGAVSGLNLNTDLRVAVGTSDPKTTTSSISLEAAVYHLAWASCP